MSFSKDLEKFKQRALAEAEKERRAICVELLRSVVMDTPVLTGRARGNWQMSANTPKRSTTTRESPSWSTVVSEEQNNVGQLGDTVYLTNNLPYIYRIEYDGWSKSKAPQGMVRRNVERIKSILRNRRLSR